MILQKLDSDKIVTLRCVKITPIIKINILKTQEKPKNYQIGRELLRRSVGGRPSRLSSFYCMVLKGQFVMFTEGNIMSGFIFVIKKIHVVRKPNRSVRKIYHLGGFMNLSRSKNSEFNDLVFLKSSSSLY